MVHRRELGGETLVFGNHGALWGNAMTWWDHGTGTVWSQPVGEAIIGPLAGATLEPLASTFTTWGAWRDAYPDTVALGASARGSGFDLDDFLIVIDLGNAAAGYPIPALRESGVINDTVAGVELAVVIDPSDRERWSVLSRRLDDRVLDLTIENGRLIDVQTGTTWDPVRGRALEGALVGETLDLLPGFTAFPRDFPTFWPTGRIWEP